MEAEEVEAAAAVGAVAMEVACLAEALGTWA